MNRLIPIAAALLLGVSSAALADQKPGNNGETPSDANSGSGNDAPGGAGGAPPGQTNNPNDLFGPIPLPTGLILADSGKDNSSDDDKGGGNQPHAPGQTTNPNPGKLFDDSQPVWLDGFVVADTANNGGSTGAGSGNSGTGDKASEDGRGNGNGGVQNGPGNS